MNYLLTLIFFGLCISESIADSVFSISTPVQNEPKNYKLQRVFSGRPVYIVLPNQSLERLAKDKKGPQKIGFPRDVEPLNSIDKVKSERVWYKNSAQKKAFAFKIYSPGAVELRMGIRIQGLPSKGVLRFYGDSGNQGYEVNFDRVQETLSANLAAGERGGSSDIYWSPTISGESVVFEFEMPEGEDEGKVHISIPVIQHHFVPVLNHSGQMDKSAAYCNNDVMCFPSSTGFSLRNGVVKLTYIGADGDSYMCSGTLLNTNPASYKPYILTANHCIPTQTAASSVQSIWFYQSPSCGGGAAVNVATLENGANLLYQSGETDTSFLLLRDAAPQGALYIGWNSSVVAKGGTGFGIHHPDGDLKKISFGTVSAYQDCTTSINGSFSCTEKQSVTGADHFSVSWTDGITEGGSSGSGFFNSSGQLIGTLHGGTSTCINPELGDHYGRFDIPYNASLKQWLNPPAQSYSLSVTKTGSGSGSVSSSPAGINCGTTCSANFNIGSSVTLTAVAASGVFSGWSGDCAGSGSTCTLSLNSNKSVSANFSIGTSGGVGGRLANGTTIQNLSGVKDATSNFFIDIPSGATNFKITTSGGSGDSDLYVKFDSQPTTTNFDCRSWNTGNSETCIFQAPASGRYFIMLNGYTAYSGLSISTSYNVEPITSGQFAAGTFVNISGNISNSQNQGLCAMVLINGSYTFSCDPVGAFRLAFPVDQNGRATMFVFASGFAPQTISLVPSSQSMTKNVVVGKAYDVSTPVVNLLTASRDVTATRANLSGRVLTQSGSPLCGMVLANGSYVFSCGGQGAFGLSVPLAPDGSVTLFVFVDGFAPYQKTFSPK